jgi:selT/selW/selH-like putative selenoprotein
MSKTRSKLRQISFGEVVGTVLRDEPAVDVLVEYCETGNYRPVALELAGAIVEELPPRPGSSVEGEIGVRVRLVPARDGRFEVFVDGRLIFSKKATCRLPYADEILYHVGVARAALEQRLLSPA